MNLTLTTKNNMKLQSMTDFVLLEYNKRNSYYYQDAKVLSTIYNLAKFLSLPLTLSMFIPSYFRNGVWIPYTDKTLINTTELFIEWEQSKENVIFEGCEFVKEHENSWKIKHNGNIYTFLKDFTIEDLIDLNLTITENAIKKYKLL